jgi:hypothetical protein
VYTHGGCLRSSTVHNASRRRTSRGVYTYGCSVYNTSNIARAKGVSSNYWIKLGCPTSRRVSVRSVNSHSGCLCSSTVLCVKVRTYAALPQHYAPTT